MKTLAYLRLDPGLSREELETLTLTVLERNRPLLKPHDDAVITHRITRGEFRGTFASADGPPTIMILCRPMNFATFARYYDEGLEVDIPPIRAPVVGGIDPRAKTHNRLLLTLGHVQIGHTRPGVVPLILDVDDFVTESSAANVHYVIGDELVTPVDEVALEGVTRRTLMLVASAAGVRMVRRRVHRTELGAAQEAIVTATSFSLLPVRVLDGRALSPVPGPVTRRLTAAFSAHAGVDIIAQSRAHRQGR
jgi:branched-subunit amino acid aminotransferase/4-amino-4-deoxychorismate lyase